MNITFCSSLFILLVISLQTSHALNSHDCSPSACGTIHNISSPFRLKHDPKECGDRRYELECENNVTTVLYLNSEKYKVKAINYDNYTIWLVDAFINNNTCSFPNHSLYIYPYSVWMTWKCMPINFMSCPFRLNGTSLLTDANDCATSNSSNSRHSYIKVGHMNASEVRDMCRIDQIALTSWKFEDLKNVSVSEIHDSLCYGFELSWYQFPSYVYWKLSFTMLNSLLIIVALIDIPAKIILGVAGSLVFYFHIKRTLFLVNILLFTVFRFILACCFVALLIYKFRRRKLSMFHAIECFLHSDNQLMPIRYSYSNIKKMTSGFRVKLGQGGYGTVYKGKLRSGYDVAVKLLGKPGGNDQDFMNEIATIGRIHHVNIVKLVGYCAEGSKRALVFDFMPNGSLDKYIYDREKMNCLSWEMKHEIVIGVARGIKYLHTGCGIQILHFDIKPHNILLDHKFTPKITDFGLAKFYPTEQKTVTLTAARGTIGYVAPELINRGFGRVSYKADVYSFGMLLIEMVGIKKDLRGNDVESSKYFPDWIYDYCDQDRDIEIGEPDEIKEEDENDDTRRFALKMTIVALWCIQMSPDNRPSMNKVLEMLEGEVEQLQIPPRPAKSTQVVLDEDGSWTTNSNDSASFLSHNDDPNFEITVQDI